MSDGFSNRLSVCEKLSSRRSHARQEHEPGRFDDFLAFVGVLIKNPDSFSIFVVFYEECGYVEPTNNLFVCLDSRDQLRLLWIQINLFPDLILLLRGSSRVLLEFGLSGRFSPQAR